MVEIYMERKGLTYWSNEVPKKAEFLIGEQHFPTKIDIAYASNGDFAYW